MVTATETVLDQARRVVRQRFGENPGFANAMPGGEMSSFLANVDSLLVAAAGECPNDITPAGLLRGVERIIADNRIDGLECFDVIPDQTVRAGVLAATTVATVSRRGELVRLPARSNA